MKRRTSELNASLICCTPSVNRNAFACGAALIEASARCQFGLESLSKAWFSHGFTYERQPGPLRLAADGVMLDVKLSVNEPALEQVDNRLLHYYGVKVTYREYTDFSAVLETLHRSLKAGLLVLSTFDLWFKPGAREWRVVHGDHMIGVTALDEAQGVIRALDLSSAYTGAGFEVELADYAECFRFLCAKDGKFTLALTERERGREREEEPFRAADIRADLESCLNNLHSTQSGIGLNALDEGTRDIMEAVREVARPFRVPRLWLFARDRVNFRVNLERWCEDVPDLLDERRRIQLDTLLEKSCRAWHAASMTCEAALWEATRTRVLQELPAALERVGAFERQTAAVLEEIYRQLS